MFEPRRVLSWLMFSPLRLLLVGAVLGGAVVAVALTHHGRGAGSDRARPVPRPSTSVAAAPSPTAAPTPSPYTTTDAYAAARRTALAFTKAWASHPAGGHQAWMDAMAPYLTPSLTRAMDTGRPDNVSASRVTGAGRITITGEPTRTEVAVPTDAGLYSVTEISDDYGRSWFVSDIEPGAQAEE